MEGECLRRRRGLHVSSSAWGGRVCRRAEELVRGTDIGPPLAVSAIASAAVVAGGETGERRGARPRRASSLKRGAVGGGTGEVAGAPSPTRGASVELSACCCGSGEVSSSAADVGPHTAWKTSAGGKSNLMARVAPSVLRTHSFVGSTLNAKQIESSDNPNDSFQNVRDNLMLFFSNLTWDLHVYAR